MASGRRSSSFLGADFPNTEPIFQQLMMTEKSPKMFEDEEDVKTLKPEPGFCVKTKDLRNGKKIFINICKTTELPAPKDISEEELNEILQSEDPSDYRVPMSLGEVHYETDKSGNSCTAYDVTIHQEFYDKTVSSLLFKTFLITISIEGLEDKYDLEIDKNDWILLKNKLYLGVMPEVKIRKRAKPLVTELTTAIQTYVTKVPKFSLHRRPQKEITTKFLEGEILLPNVDCKDILLDVGEDRIKLEAFTVDRSEKYFLDVFVPLKIVPYETSALFLAKRKVLSVSMPYSTSEE